MKLNELLDTTLLARHIENRFVSCQNHPTLPLKILNYSHLAQYNNEIWGDGVIDYCRGLIVDFDGSIVARGFKKFWNLGDERHPETLEKNLPLFEPTITKKLDGSLGIYYRYDGQEGVATRGSFTSEQAKWATNWFREHKNPYKIQGWVSGITPLFEIIYPENRIVVSYDFASLVLIGLIDNRTGFEYPYWAMHESAIANSLRVVDQISGAKLEELKVANIENEEGYVLTYYNHTGPPLKVKVKMADYVRLHRIITGMNPRSVWDMLNTGSYDPMKFEDCPKEFKIWLDLWVKKLYDEFRNIKAIGEEMFANRPIQTNPDKRAYRAECAAYFKAQNQPSMSGVFFGMLDGKDVDSIIWDMIEPRGDDMTFRKDGE